MIPRNATFRPLTCNIEDVTKNAFPTAEEISNGYKLYKVGNELFKLNGASGMNYTVELSRWNGGEWKRVRFWKNPHMDVAVGGSRRKTGVAFEFLEEKSQPLIKHFSEACYDW